ncbi:hypothetical protein [Streptomyces fructofermentans]|uniref:Uncharacterized protein n=1 Tax=Streptomyces fructofermentans TaxID=152141 RepID=A0A918NUX7_9ACTN|nr:hypothetical protein [Streptomyces fructofermentans]GGX98467.1 hypothetical protein GCM10010515_75830 [Streptomyces fructofermentans]
MDRDSTEHLMTPVTAVSGDPSTYPVHVAVLPVAERPTDNDWHEATWTVGPDGEHCATLLVGPDGVIDPGAEGPGTFRTWVKITAPPEEPVIPSARFEIT